MSKALSVVSNAALFGVAGWAFEHGRHSPVFRGYPIPIAPVYAAGGVMVTLLKPHLASYPPLVRAGVYGAMATALEYGGGFAERKLASGREVAAPPGPGVDWKRSVLWGVAGLIAESVTR